VAHGLGAAIPLSTVAGIGFAPVLSCTYLLIAKQMAADLAAEAFMWTTAGLVAGIAAGSALGGPLVQDVGVPWAFVVGVAVNAAAALVAFGGRSRLQRDPGEGGRESVL